MTDTLAPTTHNQVIQNGMKRILNIMNEKDALAEDMKELKTELKSKGVDMQVLMIAVKEHRKAIDANTKRTFGVANTVKFEAKNSTGFEPSRKQMVFDAIIETTKVDGIMIPEIKESIFKKCGISVSSTTIDDKVNELKEEKLIYQINEGKQRSKKYLPKK